MKHIKTFESYNDEPTERENDYDFGSNQMMLMTDAKKKCLMN